jgi:hypothetical protein
VLPARSGGLVNGNGIPWVMQVKHKNENATNMRGAFTQTTA